MKIDAARRLALQLPGCIEAPHHQTTSFRVNGKIFATAPPTRDTLHVFIGDDERERALALAPGVVDKLMWGGKVVGVRVMLAQARPSLVRELLAQAWRRKAPARMLSSLNPPEPS
jgi:hypothetical protein